MANTSTVRLSPQKQGASIATLLFGIWLFIAGFVLASTPEGRWNSVVVGMLLLGFSALRLRRDSSLIWSCANVVLGLWMLYGPRPLVYMNTPLRWSDFALGWAVVTLSIMAATGHDRIVNRDSTGYERVSPSGHHGVA